MVPSSFVTVGNADGLNGVTSTMVQLAANTTDDTHICDADLPATENGTAMLSWLPFHANNGAGTPSNVTVIPARDVGKRPVESGCAVAGPTDALFSRVSATRRPGLA